MAFADGDAAGAKRLGYPIFGNNRQNAPAEVLGVATGGAGPSLADLVRFLG